MPINPTPLIPLKPEPMDIDLYETTSPPLSDAFSTARGPSNSIPDYQSTGNVLPAASTYNLAPRDFNFEDELAMNLASLALSWKPLNPDNTGRGTINSSTVESGKPIHPLFPCPIGSQLPIYDAINTQEPEKSKENPSKPKRFHPYRKKKDKPEDKEDGYIIHTTRKPEDRSKYLDPSLDTTMFWQFVQERNTARTEEIREARRIAIAMSERGSVLGSSSIWDRDDRSIGPSEIDEVHTMYGPEDEHDEDEDKEIENRTNQSSLSLDSRMEKEGSLRGVELIDTSPKKWKVSPNKNFLKRLLSNVERYNGKIKEKSEGR
ncbi:hypothetical protein V866_008397 [Kwoniella sp. B9012]|uniref:Uncharacterized protein n=1 Tax=Kwoniella europaea PYCC6329 TaxID=1423913 RepID=A0AAX4KVQ4_9TREE